MAAWRPTNGAHGPKTVGLGVGGLSWADLGGLALDRGLLSRDERVAFATATISVAVLAPPRVVRGDPLPIEFEVVAWPPEWESLAGGAWPTGWGSWAVRFTLDRATVAGEPIDLVQFGPGDAEKGGASPAAFRARAIATPAAEHPRADLPPGVYTIRVEMTARLNTALPRILEGIGRFGTPDALGFPEAGWPVTAETTFEIVERGPTRKTVPLVRPFGYAARLENFGGTPGDIVIEWPRGGAAPERPPWVWAGHTLAARVRLRFEDTDIDLGPIVLPDHRGSMPSFPIPPGLAAAIHAAPPGSAFLLLTPDPEVARLVTAPGPLIEAEPIEVRIGIDNWRPKVRP